MHSFSVFFDRFVLYSLIACVMIVFCGTFCFFASFFMKFSTSFGSVVWMVGLTMIILLSCFVR